VIIFALSSSLLGSLATGAVVSVSVVMIVVDVLGVMALAGVSLNAVSLVNLVICVGIGVEFCAHIARAFMFPSKSVMERARNKFRGRDVRAWTAMVNVGGSVFSGIGVTKFLGVVVLAFTRSKIFEVYYFRIWLALVVLASAHALVWLPVALSFAGGDGKSELCFSELSELFIPFSFFPLRGPWGKERQHWLTFVCVIDRLYRPGKRRWFGRGSCE
jgi:Niemann-Pick C1 protein